MEEIINQLQQIKPKTVNKDGYTGGYADAIDYAITSIREVQDENKLLREALEKMCAWHEKQATYDKGDNGYYPAKRLLRGE